MDHSKQGLGRLYAPDERDKAYPLKALLPKKASTRTYRYWNQNGWWGDQGETSQCVGYSCTHYLTDGPITNSNDGKPWIDPITIYKEAQKRDPWAHIPHDGSTVRAAAQYLKDIGYISEYRWTWSVAELVQALLEVGPVVVGTIWTWDMFEPDGKGFITATGPEVGGHAYLLNGVNVKEQKLRIKNSWGRGWGNKGNAWISFNEFEKLLNVYGEVMLAVEVKG